MVRILSISDVASWLGYHEALSEWSPHIVALAGDLTDDGFANFGAKALESLPGFRSRRVALERRFGVVFRGFGDVGRFSGPNVRDFSDALTELSRRFERSPAYFQARSRIQRAHAAAFYAFLRHAGKQASVVVICGDHDDAASGYSARRINRIPGCEEISGKVVDIQGVRVLGLGFQQAGYRRELRRLSEMDIGGLDVVVAHAPQKNVPLLSAFRTRLILRGHFGGGAYRVSGVPIVFTSWGHAVVDLPKRGIARLRVGDGHDAYLTERYPWLTPYIT